jgi:hypothetical protein
MHFGAVYVAGRLMGADHLTALRAAIASQALDDYRNLAAPSVKARAANADPIGRVLMGGDSAALVEMVLDVKGFPKAEFGGVPSSLSAASYAQQYRFANNAHALGVSREQSQQVAYMGIGAGNVTLFGLGLHTVGDFLAHANTTGKLTFGHQVGENESMTKSGPLSTSADDPSQNPRKALATFYDFMKLWGAYLSDGAAPASLSESQLQDLDVFLRSSNGGVKLSALESLLKSVNAGGDIADFEKFYNSADDRRMEFEKMTAAPDGKDAVNWAAAKWLSNPNDSPVVDYKVDVSPYTDDPALPSIARYQFAQAHSYRPGERGVHYQP